MKKIMTLVGAVALVFLLGACTPQNEEPDPNDNTGELKLTIEELAMYDGTNGNPAYIAVDGVIYDVTDNEEWTGGSHQGYGAGQDLTEEIASLSPHGTAVLSGLPIVGEIVASDPVDEPTMMYLTIAELAMYDGQGDSDAYIAVEGLIYDVTDVEAWSGGSHNGLSAGQDLTQEIASAPHGESVLTGLTQIGELVIDSTGDGPYDPYLYLTLTELAMYDGQDGNDAYVAVNGVIYDVTGVPAWSDGTHNGNTAGTDVSSVINNAPHGESVLDGLTVVGELIS